MGVVNLGVRNHCTLQQMRAGARLGITRHTHSRVPKTSRQEPYSESTVWVIFRFRTQGQMFAHGGVAVAWERFKATLVAPQFDDVIPSFHGMIILWWFDEDELT